MATSNTTFNVSELDFDTIKSNLKEYLRSQDRFSDYDFEGSGLNILLDILAYNTHYMGYYMNMIANEGYLDSAVIRDSVISRAKHLQYTPTSMRSATANVTIVVTPPSGNTISQLLLPIYTAFQSESVDGINYSFVTTESTLVSKNLISNTFTFSGVTLKQGEHFSYEFPVTSTNPQTPFEIPSSNIDTSTLLVSVQASDLDTTTTTYTLANDITTLTSNSNSYFLQAGTDNKYSIYFGDGYLGRQLSNGNIVIVDYIDTDGPASNKANVFTPMASIGGFSNVSVQTNSSASGGSLAEDIDTIKFRAPLAYVAQNRAVNVFDYSTLLQHDYPNIDQISVWGGEDNDPIVYGKVFLSLKPRNGYVITNIEKDRIIDELIRTRNVMTVIPEIVDPDYLYLLIRSRVYYDITKTNLSPNDISTIVSQAIINYTDEQLGQFNKSFKFSRLQNTIDTSHSSVENSDLKITLQKRLTPDLGISRNYTVYFNAELQRGTLFEKLYTYPSFTIYDSNGVLRTAYIEEVEFSYTGVSSVDVTDAGSDYIESPTVTITGDGSGATAVATIKNGKVSSIRITNSGTNYTIATVTLTNASGDYYGSGATAQAILNRSTGTLQVFYYKTNGEKVIINSNIGTIDYENGILYLYNFKPIEITENPNYASGILTFNIGSNSQTISPSRNRIITLDTDDPLSLSITSTKV